jgi:glycosyltransferase involved in cell wall biosynthesis
MQTRAVSDPPPSAAGWIVRSRLVRVGVNVEQLLSRSPGGIGRYSAQLAMLLARVAPTDEVVPFVARHPRAEAERALAAAGVAPPAAILPLPRPLLYESWVRWGLPPLTFGARAGAHADVDLVHAPSLAVPGRGRRPLVVTVHDAAPELWPDAFTARGRAFHARGAAAAASRADLVIAVSEAAADEIAAHTPIFAGRIRVVHHAVTPPPTGPPPALRLPDGPFVLWVGTLEPRKGVATLVAAMARRAARGAPRVPLVLAGYDGWLADRLPGEARAALGDDLVELGRLGEAELWGAYRAATVFAFPSRHEGFGLPPLEAMSQGTPVVASDLPATREVLGDAAVLAPAGDEAAWADALDALLSDDAERARRATAGETRAARFGVDRFVEATRAVYREATGG